MNSQPRIAYFSMEIALRPDMPTYSGGLGVLAGDHLRAAADMGLPLIGVTLLHRLGYFCQRLDAAGRQTEQPCAWPVGHFLRELPERAELRIEDRRVVVRAWRHDVNGIDGFEVPVLFIDTDLPENSDWDRHLTDRLYGGDDHYRLCQEAVLGIGGVRLLRALGHGDLKRYHLNEGHAALLALELLDETAKAAGHPQFDASDIEAVRSRCIFTTHTPVPAGHDKFPLALAARVLGRSDIGTHRDVFCCEDTLNLTFLALNLSHYHNGVAESHGMVSKRMFPGYAIDSITNGIHLANWASEPIHTLFDRYLPGWERDNQSLRNALRISRADLWAAHQQSKTLLAEYLRNTTGSPIKHDLLTLGSARRATAYKRGDLLFHDLDRLRRIADAAGGLQIVLGGKAHPADTAGKEMIARIFRFREALKDRVRVDYLEDYGLEQARLLVAGVDLWVNTPAPPMEASGTSGMKAALNGVPSLSVLDGWWLEGHIEDVTGWAVGPPPPDALKHDDARDAASLYEKLESQIVPLFTGNRDEFINRMRLCIALNGAYFNSHRMLQQYSRKAYAF